MAGSTGHAGRGTSCAVANAPMAANVAWHSEIVPPMPVITTIDRRMSARHVPPMKIASH